MAMTVNDVMTSEVQTVDIRASVGDAARMMRDHAIGDVVVTLDGRVCGIVTDRDIVVRGIAEGADMGSITVDDVCGHTVESIASDASTGDAAEMMRRHDIRRLPVIDGGELVGIISLGDLAAELDPGSALGDISEAPPNN